LDEFDNPSPSSLAERTPVARATVHAVILRLVWDEDTQEYVRRPVSETSGENLLTSAGIVQMAAQCYGTSGLLTNGFVYIGLSADSLTETSASTALSTEIAANGLSRAIATVTLPTGSGLSTTLRKTFNVTGSQTVQKAALFTAASSGVMQHPIAFASSQSLVATDQFRVTFTVTASGVAPALGVHTNAFIPVGTLNDPLVTSSVTRTSGSLMLAGVAHGNISNFSITGAAPQDNKGNPAYTQVGSTEAYASPNQASGTGLYKLVSGTGGSGYHISVAQGLNGGGNNDEVTILLAEIIGGTVVQDFAWNQDAVAHPTTSSSVTTTGPATLVAFWWGGGASFTSMAVDSGWTVIETHTVASGLSEIQAAMAVRQVSDPGTYNITWTATPAQSAEMWIAAVQ
jgi:hypothetical protein